MQSSMLMIWLGALLVIAGVLFMAAQPMWRGRLSKAAAPADGSLEPSRPARGFGFKANWPGFAMVAAGAILLLVGRGRLRRGGKAAKAGAWTAFCTRYRRLSRPCCAGLRRVRSGPTAGLPT